MQIADSLRQECMPDMVYCLCKLISSKKCSQTNLTRYITLGDAEENKKSKDNYNKVYNFAKECGFIGEQADGTVICFFDKKDVESFRRFRYAVFKETMGDLNSKFPDIAKWYLNQDKKILSISKSEDFMAQVPAKFNVSQEYILGLQFWMEALGLAKIFDVGSGRRFYFAINDILNDWLKFDKPFRRGHRVLVSEFVDVLTTQCPVFNNSFHNNTMNFSMSSGLRILYENQNINLIYTKDSGNVWHLTNSLTYQETNNITEIEVR